MNKNWRLILDSRGDGYYNMAADEAILEYYSFQKIPTLRIYGWDKPFITLGYNQIAEDVLNLEKEVSFTPLEVSHRRCLPRPRRGLLTGFTRRITGGSAILHDREVTYSMVCSLEDLGLPKGVKESYEVICSFLRCFYGKLGLRAEFAKDVFSGGLGEHKNFCFSCSQHFDLLVEGKKIGGNAQKRKKDIIFQHGSIPQEINFARIKKMIKGAGPLEGKTTSLNTALKEKTNFLAMRKLLKESFRDNFGVYFTEKGLCEEEKEACRRLIENKYKSEEWNTHGKSNT